MDQNIRLSAILLVTVVVIGTVTSFNNNDNSIGDFGDRGSFGDRDYFNRKYQSWLDKRGLGEPYGRTFGSPIGEEERFFNWRDFLSNGISKRQLNYGPRSFGNFQRYFTNGLQDWRSTYSGLTRRDAGKRQAQPLQHTDA